MSHAEFLEALQLFFALGDRLESVFYLDKQDFTRFRQETPRESGKRRAKTSVQAWIALEMAGWLM